MSKPVLRIIENFDGIPTRGVCSACSAIVFSTSPFLGTKADNQTALRASIYSPLQRSASP